MNKKIFNLKVLIFHEMILPKFKEVKVMKILDVGREINEANGTESDRFNDWETREWVMGEDDSRSKEIREIPDIFPHPRLRPSTHTCQRVTSWVPPGGFWNFWLSSKFSSAQTKPKAAWALQSLIGHHFDAKVNPQLFKRKFTHTLLLNRWRK